MTGVRSNTQGAIIDLAAIGARWLLGALFVYTGLEKVLDPVAFLKLVRQYDLVHAPFLLNSIAATLPWFEACCGVLLLLGIGVRGTALTLVAVLVPFTAVVWHRALILEAARLIPFCAVKFDCGCGTGEVFICAKLFENFCLILLSCWLLTGRGRGWALRYSLAGL
ncbi:MAG TPA: DoxX family protein [Candidatus Baltobacteraceae bacterium]|jgi:uncharacterized membrane protein YphA (DoxX/SURF4 family)|nr:DoxX family protein [Candidatus Baltobacteraceae bacterium]